MKWRTDSAMEFTWPGVPVTAWANMLPCRSNTPAERSPDSRTMGLKAVRNSVWACSSTTARSRFHMICRWIAERPCACSFMSGFLRRNAPLEHDAALGVDVGIEGGGDDGGRLVLGNDGGTRHLGAGRQVGAPIDRDLAGRTRLVIEEAPSAGGGCREAGIGGGRSRGL